MLRSENPGAMYEQHHESRRCSVVVPLEEPQPGTGSVTITYKFMCKTSCVTGKTRRNMAVIFTLERIRYNIQKFKNLITYMFCFSGEVLGRQLMYVKVCSCPRRDMEKEEQVLRRKIKQENTGRDKLLHSLEVSLLSWGRFGVMCSCSQIVLPDVEMFKKVLEFNHGGVSSLLRTTPHNDPKYLELIDFLSVLEEKL